MSFARSYRTTLAGEAPTLRGMWTLTVTDNHSLTDNGWQERTYDTADEALEAVDERLGDFQSPETADAAIRLDDRGMVASLSFTVTDALQRDVTFELERD